MPGFPEEVIADFRKITEANACGIALHLSQKPGNPLLAHHMLTVSLLVSFPGSDISIYQVRQVAHDPGRRAVVLSGGYVERQDIELLKDVLDPLTTTSLFRRFGGGGFSVHRLLA